MHLIRNHVTARTFRCTYYSFIRTRCIDGALMPNGVNANKFRMFVNTEGILAPRRNVHRTASEATELAFCYFLNRFTFQRENMFVYSDLRRSNITTTKAKHRFTCDLKLIFTSNVRPTFIDNRDNMSLLLWFTVNIYFPSLIRKTLKHSAKYDLSVLYMSVHMRPCTIGLLYISNTMRCSVDKR